MLDAAIKFLKLCVLVALFVALINLARFVEHTGKTLDDLDAKVTAAAGHWNDVADKLEQTSNEQRLYWKVISHDAARTIESANAMIQHTDQNLNQVVLPQVAKSLEHSDTNIADLHDKLVPILENAAAATKGAADLAQNKDLAEAIKKLNETATQVKATSENVQQTSAEVRDEVHELTHPKKPTIGMRIVTFTIKEISGIGSIIRLVLKP